MRGAVKLGFSFWVELGNIGDMLQSHPKSVGGVRHPDIPT